MVPETLPFPLAEYRRRQDCVRARMRTRGIDVLYVTSPANLLYLTGYEAIWYPSRLPVGVALAVDDEELVLFDWTRHDAYAASRVLCDALVLFDYADAAASVTGAFTARGWADRVVGVERYSANPAPAVLIALVEAMERAGATVTSGDGLVDGVSLYKSAAELACIRRAAAIADSAMRQLQSDLRPGMSEMEVSAHLTGLLAARGSGYAAMPPLVNSGPTAWADVHAFPTQRRLETGDVVVVDCCGVVEHYHANLGRSFLLGAADHPARAILDWAADGLGELLRLARPGEGPEIALAAAIGHVRQKVADENIWWIGGYALGLGLSPSWVGQAYLANDGAEKWTWQPGAVTNYETVLVDRRHGFAAECIDTVVMTEQGLDILSGLPRGLLAAGSPRP